MRSSVAFLFAQPANVVSYIDSIEFVLFKATEFILFVLGLVWLIVREFRR
jgi:hypothetical protein